MADLLRRAEQDLTPGWRSTVTGVFYPDVTGGGDPDPPPPPTLTLSGGAPGPTSVLLGWTAVDGVTRWQLQRDGVTVYQDVTRSFLDEGLAPSSTYFYRVRAFEPTVGSWSNVVEVTTAADEEPYDADLGTIGNRPQDIAKPGAANTGPRASTTQTLSASQAITAALGAGDKTLRRALINGRIQLNNRPECGGLIFEDCIINAGGAYGVQSNLFSPSNGQMVEFRFCEIWNASSASVYGRNWRVLRCNVHRGVDLFKPTGACEIYATWGHDTDHPSGAHSDDVQVQGGTGILIHWSTFEGRNSPESETNAGSWNNGVLQTGSVNGNIQMDMLDNWVDGGNYTLRATNATGQANYNVVQIFRRNKHGRNFNNGPISNMGNLPAGSYDSSNVWEDTGLPVSTSYE